MCRVQHSSKHIKYTWYLLVYYIHVKIHELSSYPRGKLNSGLVIRVAFVFSSSVILWRRRQKPTVWTRKYESYADSRTWSIQSFFSSGETYQAGQFSSSKIKSNQQYLKILFSSWQTQHSRGRHISTLRDNQPISKKYLPRPQIYY